MQSAGVNQEEMPNKISLAWINVKGFYLLLNLIAFISLFLSTLMHIYDVETKIAAFNKLHIVKALK